MKLNFSYRQSGEGSAPPQPYQFEGEFCIIGRSEGHLILKEPRCSKRHCIIFVSHEEKLMVKDLGSSNGTFLNSQRIDEAELKIGDEIRIGKTSLRLTRFENQFKAKEKPIEITKSSTKTTSSPEPIAITETGEPSDNGLILRGWPGGYSALPKDKAEQFIEYVETDGTKARLVLGEISSKKKAG